ncbi:MAG TPA: rhodanese-like domain-containing protein [Dissulfurispiraceae bacterium]|nr:rhodanese-like domain-containing protein [Dissulfurispiraceae bacterium]
MERTVTPKELKHLANPVIIDVRREADFTAEPGMIDGAIRRLPAEVSSWANELPKDRDVVIYCVRGGSVSNSVLDVLLDKGVNARFIEGGIEAWKKDR